MSSTGTVTELSIPEEGDVVIHLLPDAKGKALLVEGQHDLACELPTYVSRGRFTGVLAKLRTGMRVEISGYYLADEAEGGIHKLRPITAIDTYPE